MHLKELKEELERVLPEHHPFLEKFLEWEPQPNDDTLSLIEVIEDWERGIRDWSEVQDVIQSAKEQL